MNFRIDEDYEDGTLRLSIKLEDEGDKRFLEIFDVWYPTDEDEFPNISSYRIPLSLYQKFKSLLDQAEMAMIQKGWLEREDMNTST